VLGGYFILLAIAIFTHQAPGGPLALPFWVIAAGLISLFYTACLVFPAVAIAEWLVGKLPTRRFIAQIPVSMLVLAVLVFGIAFGSRLWLSDTQSSLLQLTRYPLQIVILLFVPLGYYWWIAKTVEGSNRGIRKIVRNRLLNERIKN